MTPRAGFLLLSTIALLAPFAPSRPGLPSDAASSMPGTYLTTEDAIVGKPLLGRPTDSSVTINMVTRFDLDVYVEYGNAPGRLTLATRPRVARAAAGPLEIELTRLRSDMPYFYRLRYRPAGQGEFSTGPEAGFHTQRAKGSGFIFTLQADSHMGLDSPNPAGLRQRLYRRTLANVLADRPDFHMDLGDFSRVEIAGRGSAKSLGDAVERYLGQRGFLDGLNQSVPFYLVLGNHEGEQGWRAGIPGDSLAIWGTLARKQVIPNPHPNRFYSGDTNVTACCGLREDYYAWQWGDALFVVLDPFWYTTRRPHGVGGRLKPSFDGWDWTLGKDQYDWFYRTLHHSKATWKFVFAHHMTGGVVSPKKGEGPYGRGGIDAARYSVAHRPTFEWGGEDSTGKYVFAEKRPGWNHGPIHEMMVKEGVDVFFRGHDHVFVHETLDGVVYQTCPAPNDSRYSSGFYSPALFSTGIEVNNSGHLRVTVSPDSVRVDYVRAVLPDDEPLSQGGRALRNGEVSYSYTLRKRDR
jgi:hypothetical protein